MSFEDNLKRLEQILAALTNHEVGGETYDQGLLERQRSSLY